MKQCLIRRSKVGLEPVSNVAVAAADLRTGVSTFVTEAGGAWCPPCAAEATTPGSVGCRREAHGCRPHPLLVPTPSKPTAFSAHDGSRIGGPQAPLWESQPVVMKGLQNPEWSLMSGDNRRKQEETWVRPRLACS